MATHCSILAWRMHGQRSLVGYSPWGPKELDMTEQLSTAQHITELSLEKIQHFPVGIPWGTHPENEKPLGKFLVWLVSVA